MGWGGLLLSLDQGLFWAELNDWETEGGQLSSVDWFNKYLCCWTQSVQEDGASSSSLLATQSGFNLNKPDLIPTRFLPG